MNTQGPISAPRRSRQPRRPWRSTAALGAALTLVTCTTAAGTAAHAGVTTPTTATTLSRPASGPLSAPAALQAALDRLVADGVPGVIAFGRQGSRVHRVTSGVRELRTGAPIRAGDRFRIGSITKSFVSTVLLQLVGEHRLRLDDTVERWLPGTVPNGTSITVRQLLNHTSGLYDYSKDARLIEPYWHDRGYYWAPRDLIDLADSHPPLFPPGASWSYSNTNYVLLGLIIQAVTGHRASDEVERRVIKPLQLRDTSFPLRDPRIAGPHTHGYLTNLPPDSGVPGGVLDTTTLSPSIFWTAGGMVSTATDLARFHQALFTGRLLRPAQQRELKSLVPGTGYGMGVARWDTPCGTAWGHNGSFPGYYSVSLTSPDGSRQAVIALNTDRILSDQAYADLDAALSTAFCGQAPAPGRRSRIRAADAGAGPPELQGRPSGLRRWSAQPASPDDHAAKP